MPVDNPVPLCTAADLESGAFADLVRGYDPSALSDILAEATRACESECGRRLAPFTLTETCRAEGIDPDELGGLTSGIPLDLSSALGMSYAAALGGMNLVRRTWLREYAPQFPDMWTYSNVSITIVTSIGGINPAAIMRGPMADSGLIWFRLGTFVPIGSQIEATYSGGYTTIPADLRRAAKYMAAAIVARELDPLGNRGHTPADLEALAVGWLSDYARD